jgi:hypothetical protein
VGQFAGDGVQDPGRRPKGVLVKRKAGVCLMGK